MLLVLAGGSEAAGPRRNGKNLRGTFPFNQGASGRAAQHQAHAHHHDHHDHAAAAPIQALDARGSRQGGGDDVALDIGSIAAAGETTYSLVEDGVCSETMGRPSSASISRLA